MTTALTLQATSTPIRLSIGLDDDQSLQIWHENELLAMHGDSVEIYYGQSTPLPLTVEILDLEHSTGNWTVNATHNGTAWVRDDDCCRSTWNETNGEIRVDVSASREGTGTLTNPLFIKVKPEGSKPDP